MSGRFSPSKFARAPGSFSVRWEYITGQQQALCLAYSKLSNKCQLLSLSHYYRQWALGGRLWASPKLSAGCRSPLRPHGGAAESPPAWEHAACALRSPNGERKPAAGGPFPPATSRQGLGGVGGTRKRTLLNRGQSLFFQMWSRAQRGCMTAKEESCHLGPVLLTGSDRDLHSGL